MGSKNKMAAVLAIMAMVNFTLMFAVICFVKVPPENKDFFNMGFMALINFVSTAIGYYLGSSLGSTQKNELLAGPLVVENRQDDIRAISEAGFVRVRVMALLAMVALLVTLAGCATMKSDPPQITAGKALLAAKQTIVTAAVSADSLCRSGQLSADKCSRALEAYEDAKRGYDSAVDAYLLMLTGGDPAQIQTSMARLQDITNNLVLLTGGAK